MVAFATNRPGLVRNGLHSFCLSSSYFSVVCMFVSPDFRVGSSNVIEATAKSMKSQIRFSSFCHLLFIAIELKGESYEGRSHTNHSQLVNRPIHGIKLNCGKKETYVKSLNGNAYRSK